MVFKIIAALVSFITVVYSTIILMKTYTGRKRWLVLLLASISILCLVYMFVLVII